MWCVACVMTEISCGLQRQSLHGAHHKKVRRCIRKKKSLFRTVDLTTHETPPEGALARRGATTLHILEPTTWTKKRFRSTCIVSVLKLVLNDPSSACEPRCGGSQ